MRGRLATLCVVLAATVVALGVGEVVVRLALPRRPSTMASVSPRPADTLPRIRRIVDLVKPGVDAIFKGAAYRTNSSGFRGREYSVEKPKDVFRIVLIGDSVTMGSGVEEEDTYAAQLEDLLNARPGARKYEVLNLGIAGLNLHTSVHARLIKIGLRFHPDLIAYGFTLNDLEGPHYRHYTVSETIIERFTSRSRLLELAVHRWRYLRDLVWPLPGSYVYELDENYFHNPPAWNDFLADLDTLEEVAEQAETCVVVLIHPHLFALNAWHPFQRHYELVENAARDRGFQVVNPLPSFLHRVPETLWVAPVDSHPNAEGHRLFAASLARTILSLPAKCQKTGPPASVSSDGRVGPSAAARAAH